MPSGMGGTRRDPSGKLRRGSFHYNRPYQLEALMADPVVRQPPAFCQYSAGPCDQSFDGIDQVTGIVLYPSHPPQIAGVIQSAVERLNSSPGHDWRSWQDFRTAGQTIFCSICRQIRFCSVVVADVTTLNFNLLFEIGFVLGLDLPLLLIRDTSYLRDLRDFNELGLLDTIGYLDFQTADGLADAILRNLPAKVLGTPPATLIRDTPMYVIKDPGLRLAGESVEITILYLYFWRESAINLAWPMNARIPSTTRGPNGSATTTKRSRGCRRSRRARPGNGIRCSVSMISCEVSTISCEVSMIGCNVRTIG